MADKEIITTVETSTISNEPTKPVSIVKKPEISISGFFSGFQISYPEYEVITPQTLQSFTVRSMTVSEEETLKGSALTPKKIAEHLSSSLWKCIVKKPDTIKSYDDFISRVTLKDRDAILYGMYHATYKDTQAYDLRCEKCGASYAVSCKLNEIFSMTAYTGNKDDILSMKIPVALDVASNITAIIKQPVLKDEHSIMSDMLFQTEKALETAIETLVIDRFIVSNSDGSKTEIITRDNIMSGYNSLPAADRKQIQKKYFDSFGQYSLKLEIKSNCSKCAELNTTQLDLVNQFFRVIMQ